MMISRADRAGSPFSRDVGRRVRSCIRTRGAPSPLVGEGARMSGAKCVPGEGSASAATNPSPGSPSHPRRRSTLSHKGRGCTDYAAPAFEATTSFLNLSNSRTRHIIPAACFARVMHAIRALMMMRAQGRPGADRTHGPRAAKSTRQNHRYEPDHPAFPARVALRLIRDLLGDRRSCPRRPRARQSTASLTSAPGGQDHTISPSAPCRSSACETHAAP
jgi:hypothetical protein